MGKACAEDRPACYGMTRIPVSKGVQQHRAKRGGAGKRSRGRRGSSSRKALAIGNMMEPHSMGPDAAMKCSSPIPREERERERPHPILLQSSGPRSHSGSLRKRIRWCKFGCVLEGFRLIMVLKRHFLYVLS